MPIEVLCEHCGKSMQVQDSHAGKRGRCPFCKGVIEVPNASAASTADGDWMAAPLTEEPARPVPPPPPSPAANTSHSNNGETTIYSDGAVTVTTSRVICGATTYALRNITSVKMGKSPPNGCLPMFLLIIGGLFVLGGLGDLATAPAGGVLVCLIGGGMLVAGYKIYLKLKPDYQLFFSSSSGELQAFTSKDSKQVAEIVEAVNEAIIRYR